MDRKAIGVMTATLESYFEERQRRMVQEAPVSQPDNRTTDIPPPLPKRQRHARYTCYLNVVLSYIRLTLVITIWIAELNPPGSTTLGTHVT
jgi:hypothetical protein